MVAPCEPSLQMEQEARYNHYVSSLQFFNLSKLDDSFRQRVVHMSGLRLVELQPDVAAGEPHLQQLPDLVCLNSSL